MKQTELYNPIIIATCVTTKKHLLGVKNPDVGMFRGTGFDNRWIHFGWVNSRINSVAMDEKSNGKIIYAAAGNGVMKSIDWGRNWKIVSGASITEVLHVAIDPLNSNTVYAACAYGIFRSDDAGKTWKEKNKGKSTPFSSRIIFDKRNSKKIYILCEDGVFFSNNKGESWSIFALEGKGCRSFSQHQKDQKMIVIGTEDDGVFISTDDGKTFIQKNIGLDHKTVYTVTMDPEDTKIIYCGTYQGGIYKSIDSGETWSQVNNGLTEKNIHSVCIFPKDKNILFAGSINEGIFRSDDAGLNWQNVSGEELDKGQVWDIQVFKEKLTTYEPVKKILEKKYQQTKYDHGYKERREFLFNFLAENQATSGVYSALAKLITGKNVAKAYQEIDEMIDSGRVQGMFLIQQLLVIYLYCQEYLPPRLKDKIRDLFKTRTFFRGDTENHWLLYYSGVYLAAQTWPNLDGSEWFNGKSSKENFEEAKGWIDFWMKTTTTIGQGEFDSPTYHPTFLVALFILFDFAKDKKLVKRSQIMLDYLLVDFAVEHLKGFYCGGHSRDYAVPPNITDQRTSPITSWCYLLFGQNEFSYVSRDFGLLFLPLMSNYQMPEIIYKIATDRENPYIHTETKRVRNIFRFKNVMNPPVYKYIYMTKNFAIGSLHGGGVLQPIQQHNWDVTFINGKPNNTIFCLHPYADPTELGMFFPDEIKLMVGEVHKYHKIYKSPDKWASGSPYEQIFQNKNAVIVINNIPKGVLFEEIDAHFPKELDERICHESGWIFCKAGKTFIAYFPLKPYEWIEEETCFRLRSRYLKNGCVMEVAADDDFPTENPFNTFMNNILANEINIADFDSNLTVKYTMLNKDQMCFTYDGDRTLNGKKIDFKDYKLFKGPYLNAEVGSGKLKITYKNKVRMLDLNKNQITSKG